MGQNSNRPSPTSKQQITEEILRAGRDPVYFITNYVMIQHPKKGLILCDLYPFQRDAIEQFEKFRLNVVVKARQLGLSTITAAYVLWYALFHKDKEILVIATKLTTATGFIKKIKVALENLPKWLMLADYTTTFQSIKFTNRSVITAVPTSEDAGRGSSLSLLVVDECISSDSIVTLRNKKTGEIKEIHIGSLFNDLQTNPTSDDFEVPSA